VQIISPLVYFTDTAKTAQPPHPNALPVTFAGDNRPTQPRSSPTRSTTGLVLLGSIALKVWRHCVIRRATNSL